MKVVKNKLAPPFRMAHASLIYGKGIPMGVAVVDMAIDYGVINKKGAWLAYKGETLGQGKEAVAKFLSENKNLQDEIVRGIMAEVNKGIGFIPSTDVMKQNLQQLKLRLLKMKILTAKRFLKFQIPIQNSVQLHLKRVEFFMKNFFLIK